MSVYKQIALALPALFWKLVDDDDHNLILDVMDIIEFYASSEYTLKSAQTVAQTAFKTIRKVVARFPMDSTAQINVKVPTMHMVLEYLCHDVPIFGHQPQIACRKSINISRYVYIFRCSNAL